MSRLPLNPKLPGRYARMTAAEMDAEVARFDRESVPTKPLTPAMKSADHRARRKAGRPKVGLGAMKIRVSVERGLLKQTDAFARRHRLSRSALIARGLRGVLAGAA